MLKDYRIKQFFDQVDSFTVQAPGRWSGKRVRGGQGLIQVFSPMTGDFVARCQQLVSALCTGTVPLVIPSEKSARSGHIPLFTTPWRGETRETDDRLRIVGLLE